MAIKHSSHPLYITIQPMQWILGGATPSKNSSHPL